MTLLPASRSQFPVSRHSLPYVEYNQCIDMDVDDFEDLLFRSSSPLFYEADETESLLFSQEVQGLDAEDEPFLFDNIEGDDEDEMFDSAIERTCYPVLLDDFSQTPTPCEQARGFERSAMSVANKIKSIFDDVCQDLNSGRNEARLVLSPCYSQTDSGEHLTTASTTNEASKTITFPGKNREEAWRFGKRVYHIRCPSTNYGGAVVSRILELVLEALTTGVTITKR